MRRLSIVLVLALAAVGWPAATNAAQAATVAAAAAGSLQADFNNDGFADLAVGVPMEDIGGIIEAGVVQVLYGSAGGLTGAGSQIFRQGAGGVGDTPEGGDGFGRALAAGDFNNDGFADLAVGVFGENAGATSGAGAVQVLYGSAGGLTGAGSQIFSQDSPGVGGTAEAFDLFGVALSAGDFNSDGFADLGVGVPFEDVGAIQDAGAINVLYGSGGGLSSAGNQQFWQGSGGAAGTLEVGDVLGAALAAGDFNNDGFADLAVGVPLEDIEAVDAAGAVDVLYGSGSGLTSAGDQQFWQGAGGVAGTAEQADLFGRALAVGDFNNNGASDLAVGVSFEDVGAVRDAGAVNVLYGSGSGLTSAGNQQFWQGAGGVAGTAEEEDVFGWAISTGDFNNNGASDLAVGVLFEGIGAIPQAGAVNVLYGNGNGLSNAGNQQFWQGAGGVAGTPEPDDEFGSALVGSDQPTGAAASSQAPSDTSGTPPSRNR
jgi:hypothetical protein